MLTARIPVGSEGPGASVSCTAQGASGSHGFEATFSDSDSISGLNGPGRPLELQTLAMPAEDDTTCELNPITVQCTGVPPADRRVFLTEYQISLVPVASPVLTE